VFPSKALHWHTFFSHSKQFSKVPVSLPGKRSNVRNSNGTVLFCNDQHPFSVSVGMTSLVRHEIRYLLLLMDIACGFMITKFVTVSKSIMHTFPYLPKNLVGLICNMFYTFIGDSFVSYVLLCNIQFSPSPLCAPSGEEACACLQDELSSC
jgi:hypothetical protein